MVNQWRRWHHTNFDQLAGAEKTQGVFDCSSWEIWTTHTVDKPRRELEMALVLKIIILPPLPSLLYLFPSPLPSSSYTLYPPSSFCFPSPTGRGTGNRDNSMCVSLHCTTIFGWSSELELAYFYTPLYTLGYVCPPLYTLGYVCPPLHTLLHPHTNIIHNSPHTCLPVPLCITLCTLAYSRYRHLVTFPGYLHVWRPLMMQSPRHAYK